MATSVQIIAAAVLILAQKSIQTRSSPEGTVLKCSQDFMFSVTQESSGVGLSILYVDGTSYSSSQDHKQIIITEQEISAECGDDLVRCKDPLILTTSISKIAFQHLVFIPLTSGLLIAELVQTGLQVSLKNSHVLNSMQSDSVRASCSPVKAFEINSDYYLACVDSKSHYVSMHRIFVNKTVLQASRLAFAPFVKFNIYPSVDMRTLSNFVYFSDDTTERMVVFAVGNSMYAIDILDYSGVSDYGGVGPNCTHVKYLEYIGGNRLLAYCNFVNVYFNTWFVDWEFQWSNALDGVPYICPNRSIELRVFSSPVHYYLKYSINSRVGNVNLLGSGFHDGICFGAANEDTLFAYSDQKSGVYVVNMKSFEVAQVMSASCEISGCLSIDIINNHYLVIRTNDANDENLRIFDTQKNVSILTVEHYTPVLFKLVSDVNYPSGCGISNGSSIVITFDDTGAVAGSLAALLVFVAVTIAVLVLIVVQKKRRPLSRPIQEAPDPEQGTDSEPETRDSQPVDIHHLASNGSTKQPITSSTEQPTTPIEERNTGAGCTQRVGNSNDSPMNSDTTKAEDLIAEATSEKLATLNKGATGTDLGLTDYLELRPPTVPYQSSSNIMDATPKLNTIDNDCEKWAVEDNRSESSHCSTICDDQQPLLPLD